MRLFHQPAESWLGRSGRDRLHFRSGRYSSTIR
jgi:hypothetical protein